MNWAVQRFKTSIKTSQKTTSNLILNVNSTTFNKISLTASVFISISRLSHISNALPRHKITLERCTLCQDSYFTDRISMTVLKEAPIGHQCNKPIECMRLRAKCLERDSLEKRNAKKLETAINRIKKLYLTMGVTKKTCISTRAQWR